MRFRDTVRVALLALPLCVYLLLPNRNFYWDGLAFAIGIEHHAPLKELLHPSHLVYSIWGALLYALAQLSGIHLRALFLMQAANSVLAAASAVLLYRILDRNLAAALLFAFSATWWRFATDANAYIPSIFFLLCAYDLLDRRKGAMLAGAAHAAAMLFHELAILFLPVMLFRLRADRRAVASYGAAAMLPVAVAYIAAYHDVTGGLNPRGFLAWIVSHAPDSGFSFSLARNLSYTLLGTLRLLVGGKPGRILGAQTVSTPARKPSGPILIWLGVYVAFLFFWMPQNTFYRLFYLPPLIALIAGPFRRIPWPAVAVVALWNFVFVALPQSREANNAPYHFALQQHDRWTPGTPIVFHRFHPDLWTISYFNEQASWVGLDHLDLAQLERNLAYARRENKDLWLEATAYDLLQSEPSGREWLSAHEQAGGVLLFKDDRHEFRFHRLR
jgi:hypothetical protein